MPLLEAQLELTFKNQKWCSATAPEFQGHPRNNTLTATTSCFEIRKITQGQSKQGPWVTTAMFLVANNCHCFCFLVSNNAQTSCISAACTSPPIQNSMPCSTRGLTCQESPKWYTVSFCWFYNLSPWFHPCNLWRDNLHSHNLQPMFPHILIKKHSRAHSNTFFLLVALSLKSILSISCVPDAVFQNLKQNWTQIHCSSHQLLENCRLHLTCTTINNQGEVMQRNVAAKLIRWNHKMADGRKLYNLPSSVPVVGSVTFWHAFCIVLDTNYVWQIQTMWKEVTICHHFLQWTKKKYKNYQPGQPAFRYKTRTWMWQM